MKRRKYGNVIRWRAWGIVGVMLVTGLALIGAALLKPDLKPGQFDVIETVVPPAVPAENIEPEPAPAAPLSSLPEVAEEAPVDDRPVVALLVDDFGNSMELAGRIVDCGLPLTWAILPYLRHSDEAARLAGERDIPFLLHLPMQAEIDGEQGPFLVGTGMGEELIREKVRDAVASLPGLVGINNHRGSKATSDARTMEAVLDEVRREGLLFVDSRTSSGSVAYQLAKEQGIPAAYNSHFLDNVSDVRSIEKEFEKVVERARLEGGTLAICHVRPRTVEFLEELASNRPEDIRFVTVPELISIPGTR